MLDPNEMVPGSNTGLSLQLARLTDHQAQRRHPNQLVITLVLTEFVMAIEILRVACIGITQVPGAAPFPEKDPGAVTIVVALIATVSGGLTLITAALGVTTWCRHSCNRITLTATLVLGITTDMVQVLSLGVRQAMLDLAITSVLQILVLLALSARRAHQWEHTHKEERLAGHMNVRGDRAVVRLGS